jgi:hypothetical protein
MIRLILCFIFCRHKNRYLVNKLENIKKFQLTNSPHYEGEPEYKKRNVSVCHLSSWSSGADKTGSTWNIFKKITDTEDTTVNNEQE